MKQIKILHLYYDLLNLYGENANIRALTNALEKQNIEVIIDFKSIDEQININNYDFIYLGSGSDENYNIVEKDFSKYIEDLKKYIDNNGFVLATGNALDLFSKVLSFKSKSIDFRIVGEQVYKFNNMEELIIGFQNRNSVIYDINEDYLFDVKEGTGFEPNKKQEGINKNNFYGTYLLGPLLIRNPYLLKYMVKELLESKNINYKEIEKDISYKAYEEFLNNFVNNK